MKSKDSGSPKVSRAQRMQVIRTMQRRDPNRSLGSRRRGLENAIYRELEVLRNLRSFGDDRAIATSFLRLAVLFAQLGRPSPARKLVEIALKHSPRAFTAETYETLRVALGVAADELSTEAARALHATGDLHRAMDLLEAVTGRGHVDAYVALAECHATLGSTELALGLLERAFEHLQNGSRTTPVLCRHRLLALTLNLDPENHEAHRRLARLHLETGNASKATRMAVEALELTPDDPANLELLAECLAKTGNGKAAISVLRTVLRQHVDCDRHMWARKILTRARSWSRCDGRPGDWLGTEIESISIEFGLDRRSRPSPRGSDPVAISGVIETPSITDESGRGTG